MKIFLILFSFSIFAKSDDIDNWIKQLSSSNFYQVKSAAESLGNKGPSAERALNALYKILEQKISLGKKMMEKENAYESALKAVIKIDPLLEKSLKHILRVYGSDRITMRQYIEEGIQNIPPQKKIDEKIIDFFENEDLPKRKKIALLELLATLDKQKKTSSPRQKYILENAIKGLNSLNTAFDASHVLWNFSTNELVNTVPQLLKIIKLAQKPDGFNSYNSDPEPLLNNVLQLLLEIDRNNPKVKEAVDKIHLNYSKEYSIKKLISQFKTGQSLSALDHEKSEAKNTLKNMFFLLENLGLTEHITPEHFVSRLQKLDKEDRLVYLRRLTHPKIPIETFKKAIQLLKELNNTEILEDLKSIPKCTYYLKEID